MNAAEITDKLGLHGLRQRAWVTTPIPLNIGEANLQSHSISSRLVPLLVTVSTKALNGSATRSAKPATIRPEARQCCLYSTWKIVELVEGALWSPLASHGRKHLSPPDPSHRAWTRRIHLTSAGRVRGESLVAQFRFL